MSDPIRDIALRVSELEDYYDHFAFVDAQAQPGGLAAEIAHMLREAPHYVIDRLYSLYSDTGDFDALHLAATIRRECIEAA